MIALGTYMKIYKVGDIVDIKANGAVQKGVSIPHPSRSYHHVFLRNGNLHQNPSEWNLEKDENPRRAKS